MTSRLKPTRARGQLGKPTRINRPVDFDGTDENLDPMTDGDLSRGIDGLNIEEPDSRYNSHHSTNSMRGSNTFINPLHEISSSADPTLLQNDPKRSNPRKHCSFLDSIADENDRPLSPRENNIDFPQSEPNHKFTTPSLQNSHQSHQSAIQPTPLSDTNRAKPIYRSNGKYDPNQQQDTMNDGDDDVSSPSHQRQQSHQSRHSPSLQQLNQNIAPTPTPSPSLTNHQPISLTSHKPRVHDTAHKSPPSTHSQQQMPPTPTLSQHQARPSVQHSQATPTLTNHRQSPPTTTPSTHPSNNNTTSSDGLYRKVIINQISYTILKILGKGGSGKVYQAIRDDNGSMCAIKEIDLAIDMNHETAITDEITLLQQLSNSPRVIKLLDQELRREVNIWYLILELGSNDFGSILQSAIQTYKQQHNLRNPGTQIIPCGGLNFTQLCHYWEQILSCVETCHILSILHLDLKPANFVTVDGSMKLIDFGIAKAKSAEYTSVIQSNIMGTISYISPEQLSSIEQKGAKVRPSSDVWALGCIFHQMIYGYTPYSEHKQAFQRIAAISNPQSYTPPSIPTFITGGDIQLDQLLRDVLRKCLQKDPKNRPTVQELLKHPLICPHTRTSDEYKHFLGNDSNTGSLATTRLIPAMKNVMKEEMDLYKLKDSEKPSTLPKDLIALLLQGGNWKNLAELLAQQLAAEEK